MASKPFCVAIRDTQKQIVETLNASGLPLDAMVAILKDLLGVISQQAEAEYQAELTKMKGEQKHVSE